MFPPIPPEVAEMAAGFGEHVWVALFHTIFHTVAHEGYKGWQEHGGGLRNHDLSNTVRRSAMAAIDLIEKEMSGQLTRENRKALVAFRRDLAGALDGEATRGTSPADGTMDPGDLLVPAKAFTLLGATIYPLLPADGGLREEVLSRFPRLFAFAFRELGLKGNEKVRALIVESMLRSLLGQSERTTAALDRMSGGQASLGSTVAEVSEQVRANAAEVSAIGEMLNSIARRVSALDVIVPSRDDVLECVGYLLVCDLDGHELKTCPIGVSDVTIGRSGQNTIVLSHRKISARHALLRADRGIVYLRDLQSKNGTSVNGMRLEASTAHALSLDQTFEIGPFRLAIAPAERYAERPRTAPTSND